MKYGFIGSFVKLAFAKTAFSYLGQHLPNVDMTSYRRRTLAEYKAIVARTPSVGPLGKNMFVMTMYAGAFFIALYKAEPELMTLEVIQGLVREVSCCPPQLHVHLSLAHQRPRV